MKYFFLECSLIYAFAMCGRPALIAILLVVRLFVDCISHFMQALKPPDEDEQFIKKDLADRGALYFRLSCCEVLFLTCQSFPRFSVTQKV